MELENIIFSMVAEIDLERQTLHVLFSPVVTDSKPLDVNILLGITQKIEK